MNKFYKLDENTRRTIFNQVAVQSGIPPVAVEKDWWVTLLLRTIFESPFGEQIVFKGGTSLSKGYKLIERFSEELEFGEIQINGVKYAIYLPHGGIKNSGIGYDCSHLALDDYLVKKRISTAID